MAKPSPRSARAPARAAAKSKKVASPEGEVGEEAPGMGIDAGLAIVTSIVLVAALVLVDMIQAKNGDGIIF